MQKSFEVETYHLNQIISHEKMLSSASYSIMVKSSRKQLRKQLDKEQDIKRIIALVEVDIEGSQAVDQHIHLSLCAVE